MLEIVNLCQEKGRFLDRPWYACYNFQAFLEFQLPGIGVNSKSRDPLRLNVGFLLNKSVGFSRVFEFEHESLKVGGEIPVRDLRGTMRFTRTAQGLYGDGQFEALVQVECDRCLEPFDLPLTPQVKELFVFPESKADDPLLGIPETGILDLNPLLREILLLEMPTHPICQPDCQGLCPVCGGNRNVIDCEHPQDDIDPRLAALKSLLPES